MAKRLQRPQNKRRSAAVIAVAAASTTASTKISLTRPDSFRFNQFTSQAQQPSSLMPKRRSSSVSVQMGRPITL